MYAFAFVLYFLTLAAIGFVFKQKQSSNTGFFVGDRKLNFWLTALSAHASDMSAWIFMGFPAAFYIGGAPKASIALGLILGMALNWQFIAKRLRSETERLSSDTLPSFFEARFQDKSHIIRLLTGAISVYFLTAYITAGSIGMGKLFESVFGIDYYVGIAIATAVVLFYVFIGGFATIAWTDFFQGMFLLGVLVFVAFVVSGEVSNLGDVAKVAADKGLSLSVMPDYSVASFVSLISLACWGLGYLGQPHIVTKFMGIKDPSEIYKSKYLGMAWLIVSLGAASVIGLSSIALFPSLENPELLFIEIVKTYFSSGIGGVILCAIIAATVSTMASQILVAASSLSEDFYKRFFKGETSSKRDLLTSRISVLTIALISLILAFNKSQTIMGVVEYAWSGLGCSFGPLMLASLYSTSVNRQGAIAGIVTGGVVAAVWPLVNPYVISVEVISMLPGFILSLCAIYLVSFLTAKEAILDPNETLHLG